ncbi:hypothetical protein [Shinella sumterensis]|uniref:hypothetical protein n=1 Tax=Shinella sumterensis TaxID=1967501 RepID=UPI00106EEDDE|nr:hypothetical protein [Shinella sumterensis]MCD1266926.1 hypothetical protein [Shinella sumterensis]
MNAFVTPLDLFRKGYDTLQIAKYFSISEAEALSQVSQARSASLRLPSPYELHPKAKPTGWPKGKVGYAGRQQLLS